MPLVSVIMNCYNSSKYLREAIDSIYSQTFTDWEIIFYDNLSTDESPDIAKSYDSRLKYFRGTEFLPLGVARNKAFEKASGNFVSFLDCDDVWMPEHLSSHLNAFQKDTIVVYGNFLIRDMASNKEYVPFDPEGEFHSGSITRHLCKKNFIWLQSALVKRDAVEKLEYPFDPVMLAEEDFDLMLRLSEIGEFRYIPEPTFIYRMHEGSWTSLRRHIFAHDASYLLGKYKVRFQKGMVRDLARQYLMTVRLDLSESGFRVFPFLRLGFNLRQIGISLLFLLFPGKNIWALKAKLRKPLKILNSFLSLFRKGK
ncbi:MAG: glycosyltransferase [Nitrospirae bacterium]|nr:glycosyltransferase [Nitrospirota bacterium]